MKIVKSKSVEDVGHMEEKLLDIGIELSEIRDRERVMKSKLAEEASTRKKEPIFHYGKYLYGGTPVQDVKKVICLVPQRKMVVVSNKDPNTTSDYAFPRL